MYGQHSPEAVLRGVLGRTYPEEVLGGALRYPVYPSARPAWLCHKQWRFFGEDGLAGEEVSIWMYEGTLKIEYQTSTLSEYTLHFSPDHQQIKAVSDFRRIETQFVSHQLHLWRRGETEWLLALRQPERSKRKTRCGSTNVVQLRFPEMDDQRADQA
jgi:hypothetical protein